MVYTGFEIHRRSYVLSFFSSVIHARNAVNKWQICESALVINVFKVLQDGTIVLFIYKLYKQN